MVLKRDVCIIPAGRWIGSFSLPRCQSDGFEVCQLHKKSQTKRGGKKKKKEKKKKEMVLGIQGERVDVCILHKNMMLFLPNFSARALFMYGPNESQALSWRKRNGWNVPVDLSQQNYCGATRLLFQFCICRLSDGCFGQTLAKCSHQASRQRMGTKSLNQSQRERGLQSATYVPFLIIMNNLQFKEKKSSHPISHHDIIFCFFFYQRG